MSSDDPKKNDGRPPKQPREQPPSKPQRKIHEDHKPSRPRPGREKTSVTPPRDSGDPPPHKQGGDGDSEG
jgi:hypothetical protein